MGCIGVSGAGTLVDQNEIHRMAQSEDAEERINAVNYLLNDFIQLPNKEQLWNDLIQLIQDDDEYVSWEAAIALGTVFPEFPDKKQAWKDLLNLIQKEDIDVRKNAAYSLGLAFPYIPDKRLAWNVLHQLTQDDDMEVRESAVYSLDVAFPYILDKNLAWSDLIRLAQDESFDVRWEAIDGLGTAYYYISDKNQAWKDIIRFIRDEDKWCSTYALCVAFPFNPNKKQAWEDIHQLTLDINQNVRESSAYALGIIFSQVPDKEQACEDLHRLTYDRVYNVRNGAGQALGLAFPHIVDKYQASSDIHRLAQDENSFVLQGVAFAIGLSFSYIPDKEQAWNDLYQLTQHKINYVQASANYSLGKVSIFKATVADDEEGFKKELEKALEFFDNSLKQENVYNTARFCLPFYRSFYTLIFKKEKAEAEIQKYLSEAKSAVGSSESKEKLLEAVENLENALKEAQNLREMNFGLIKCNLDAYRRYCERAADLLAATEEKAPSATKLIQRGLPIIDQKIKEILAEIQENAKALCKQTKNTQLEDLGKEVIRVSQTFPQIRDPIGLEKGFINLWAALSSICAKMPEEERGEACELLKKANNEPYIEDKLPLINMVLSKISSQISTAKNIDTVGKKLNEIMVSLKLGIREELVISVGAEFGGTGAQHVITIPLQDISYPNLEKDMEKINGKGILKLSSLPAKLAEKVKSYLVRNEKTNSDKRT